MVALGASCCMGDENSAQNWDAVLRSHTTEKFREANDRATIYVSATLFCRRHSRHIAIFQMPHRLPPASPEKALPSCWFMLIPKDRKWPGPSLIVPISKVFLTEEMRPGMSFSCPVSSRSSTIWATMTVTGHVLTERYSWGIRR